MSYAEFVEWQAFAAHEPIGDDRADLRSALLLNLLANVHKGKNARKPKLTDFITDFWNERRGPRALAAKFRALTANAPAVDKTEDEAPDMPTRGRGKRG